MISDRFFTFATHKSLQAHSENAPTFSYIFNIRGKHSAAAVFNLDADEWGSYKFFISPVSLMCFISSHIILVGKIS